MYSTCQVVINTNSLTRYKWKQWYLDNRNHILTKIINFKGSLQRRGFDLQNHGFSHWRKYFNVHRNIWICIFREDVSSSLIDDFYDNWKYRLSVWQSNYRFEKFAIFWDEKFRKGGYPRAGVYTDIRRFREEHRA